MRKVRLPSPRDDISYSMAPPPFGAQGSARMARSTVVASREVLFYKGSRDTSWPSESRSPTSSGDEFSACYERIDRTPSLPNLAGLTNRIDFASNPADLVAGDISGLDADLVRVLHKAASHGAIREVADRLAMPPLVLLIGLLAVAAASRNRAAERVGRAIFGPSVPSIAEALAEELGLAPGNSMRDLGPI
jgi:hypothetical protein